MGSVTKYLPNGNVATEVDSGFSMTPGAFNPGSGLPRMPQGLPDLSGPMNARLAIEAAREKRAAELHALQLAAMNQSLRANRPETNRFSNHEGDLGKNAAVDQLQLAAMQRGGGEDVFVKPMGLMNASGGYGAAGVGEVGGAYAGRRAPGSIPQNAYIQGRGMESPAGLGDDDFDPLRRNRSRLGGGSEINMGGPNVGQPRRG